MFDAWGKDVDAEAREKLRIENRARNCAIPAPLISCNIEDLI